MEKCQAIFQKENFINKFIKYSSVFKKQLHYQENSIQTTTDNKRETTQYYYNNFYLAPPAKLCPVFMSRKQAMHSALKKAYKRKISFTTLIYTF